MSQNPPEHHFAARFADILGLLNDGMRNALGRASSLTPEVDQCGHLRNAEFGNALALAKAAAKLGFALAKLDGTFRHNIRVEHHKEGVPPPEN